MKKTIRFLSLALALIILVGTFAACGGKTENVEAEHALTHDELVEKAMAETGTFVVYGNTSRISTAAEDFAALYNITVESNNLKDQEIYTKLRSEEGSSAADMVMIQDGAQLHDAIDEGLVYNYVPESVKAALEESDQQPALVHQYINNCFFARVAYNNSVGANIIEHSICLGNSWRSGFF